MVAQLDEKGDAFRHADCDDADCQAYGCCECGSRRTTAWWFCRTGAKDEEKLYHVIHARVRLSATLQPVVFMVFLIVDALGRDGGHVVGLQTPQRLARSVQQALFRAKGSKLIMHSWKLLHCSVRWGKCRLNHRCAWSSTLLIGASHHTCELTVCAFFGYE